MPQKLSESLLLIVGAIVLIALFVIIIFRSFKVSEFSPGDFVPEEVAGEVVYIAYPVAITLDGDLSDWEGLPVSEVVDKDAANPAENGSFKFSVAADLEFLYVTMQMRDQNIIAGKHGSDFWNEDSFEFYINASDDLAAKGYINDIFQININAADIGNTDPDALTITGVNNINLPVRGYVFATDDGWGFEIAVPLEGLIEVEHGMEIGFQAQINGASELDRDAKLIWSNLDANDQSWENPSLYGRAIFFEIGQTNIPASSLVANAPETIPPPETIVIPELVSVNQIGYFIEGQKIAYLATPTTEALDWVLIDSNGENVLDGQTRYKGEDAASGDNLHIIDFSAFTIAGSEYQIMVGELASAPFDISNDIYSPLRSDALAYFYHNRSGIPIDAAIVGEAWARPAGHETDNLVTCFKGVDADGVSWPGCDYAFNVSGGWYDAGDFGKYVVNGGISAWTLMNLYERHPAAYPDGSLNIPENGNGVSDILDEARWEMEFLLSMQVPAGQDDANMVHHKIHDLSWAPLPMVPPTTVDNDNEHQFSNTGRYLYPPTTAATLNLAATAAQCARIWADIDPEFSARCLSAAEASWQAAVAHPDVYLGDTPGSGGGNYDDTNMLDEFYWAAAELFITTGQKEYQTYLTDASLFAKSGQFDWGNTAPLGTISLVSNANKLTAEQNALVKESIITFADRMIAIQNADGYSVLLDGDYPWGSNGLILNNMILVSIAYDITQDTLYLDAVRESMDYIMGRNGLNISFVTGYGAYPMTHPHHRFWAYDPNMGYPPPPPGAVSGGPNSNPTDPAALNAGLLDEAPAKRYIDDLESYSTNEVTINWNAPLVWIATFLDETSDSQ